MFRAVGSRARGGERRRLTIGARSVRQRLAAALALALLLAAAIVATAVAAHAADATRSDSTREGTRPDALWKEFPLRVAPAEPLLPPTARSKAIVAAAPQAVVRSPDSSRTALYVGALALLVVLVTGGALLAFRGPAARWGRALRVARAPDRFTSGAAYVLILPGRMGYGERLFERTGKAPELGEVIYDEEIGRGGKGYLVELVGPSPLPGDKRPCAFLLPL